MRRNPVGYQAYMLENDAHVVGFWANLARLASTTTEQAAVRLARALFRSRRDELRTVEAVDPWEATSTEDLGALKPYGARTRAAQPSTGAHESASSSDSAVSRLAHRLHASDRARDRFDPLDASPLPPPLFDDPPPPVVDALSEDPLGSLFPDKITGFFTTRDSQALKNDRQLVESSRQGEEALEAERMDPIEEDPFLAHVARDLIVLERQNALARMKMAMSGMGPSPAPRSLKIDASQVAIAEDGVQLPKVASPMTPPFREISSRPAASAGERSRGACGFASPSQRVAVRRDQTQLLLEHNKFLSQSIHRLAEGYFNAGSP